MRKLYLLALLPLLASPAVVRAQALTLEQCIERACQANLQVHSQTLAVEQQTNTLQTQRLRYLPSVSAYASQQFGFGRALTIDNTYANQNTASTSFGAQAQLELFDGLSTKRGKDVETLNLRREEASLEAIRQDLALSVTQAYLQALCQAELSGVARRQLDLTRLQQTRKEALLAQGKAAQWEVSEARSLAAQDELSLTQALGNERLALLDLRQLLEMGPGDTLALTPPTAEGADTLLDRISLDDLCRAALTGRADIAARQLAVDAAQGQVKLTKSGYIPTLSFSASVGTNYYHSSGYDNASFGDQMSNNLSENIGLNLSVPIFNKCATRNGVRSARLQVQQQQVGLESARKELVKAVEQAHTSALTARETLRSANVALLSAEDSYTLAAKRYENGLATATDFAEARQQRVQALSRQVQAKYELQLRVEVLRLYANM